MAATTAKWLRITGFAVLAATALVMLAVAVAIWGISDDTYRSWLAGGATKVLQREVTIAGEFSLTRSLTPVLRAGEITVANAPWGSRPDMLSVGRLELHLELLPLLRGALSGSLTLSNPDLLWEIDAAGHSNWDFRPGADDRAAQGPGDLEFRRIAVRIEDGHIAYRNPTTGRAFDTAVNVLTGSYDPVADELSIDGNGAHNGIEVTIAGQAAQPAPGGRLPLDLRARSRGAELQIVGSIDPRSGWDLDLDISAQVDAPAEFSPWFEAALPELGRLQAKARLLGAAADYRLENVDLSLDGAGMQVAISGAVTSFSTAPDLALGARVTIADLTVLKPFAVYLPMLDDLPKLGPVRVAAELSAASGRYRLEHIDAGLNSEGFELSLTGSVTNLSAAPDLELEATARVENLSRLREFSALAPALAGAPAAGPVTASGRLTAMAGEYELRGLTIRLEEEHRQLDITGSVTGFPDRLATDLSVSARVTDLSDLAELIPLPLPAIGPVSLVATVRSHGSFVDVTDLDLRLDQDELTATAHGAVRNILDRPDIDLWLTTRLEYLSDLSELSARVPDFPRVGPVNVSAHVYGRNGNLSVLGFDARLDRDHLKLDVLGSVQDLLGEPDVNLQINADVDHLAELAEIPGMPAFPVPDLGRVTGTAHVQGIGADYRLGKLHADLHQDGLQIAINGTVDDMVREPRVDIGFTGRMVDLGQLELLGLPLELPHEGPVTAGGRLSGSKGRYDLALTRAEIDKQGVRVSMTGTISDLLSGAAYDLNFSTGDEPLADLRPLDLWLPETLTRAGPLTGSVRVKGVGKEFAVEDIDVVVSRDALELAVTGAVRGFLIEPVAELQVSFATPTLPPLLELLSLEVPAVDQFSTVGPIRARSDLVVTGRGFNFGQIDAKVGNSDARGEVGFSMGGSPRSVDVRIVSGTLDLDELFPPEEPVAEQEAPHPDRPAFSDKPFPVAALHSVDLSVNVETDRLVFREFEWGKVGMNMNVAGGKITLSHAHSKGSTGSVALEAQFDAVVQPPSLTINASINEVGLAELFGLPAGIVEGATTNGWLEVRGSGESPEVLMGGLNAAGLLDIGEMRVLDSALRVVSSDILTGIFGTLNPLAGEDGDKNRPGFTPYRCGVVGFVIEDGTMTSKRGIAFESERFNVGGRGTIDLKSGAINIEVRPRATKGLGISLASMTGGFRVGGTLSEPKITLSIAGLAETTAVGALGTAVAGATAATAATGGAALIPFVAIGIHGRMTAGNFSCKNTRERLDKLFEKRRKTESP